MVIQWSLATSSSLARTLAERVPSHARSSPAPAIFLSLLPKSPDRCGCPNNKVQPVNFKRILVCKLTKLKLDASSCVRADTMQTNTFRIGLIRIELEMCDCDTTGQPSRCSIMHVSPCLRAGCGGTTSPGPASLVRCL